MLPPDGKPDEPTEVTLDFDNISDAKLVLTDELLALAKERAKPGTLGDGSDYEEPDDERSNEDG